MKKRTVTGLWTAGAMLVLILDAKSAVQGGIEGIELCLKVVIPSLFPLFVITMLFCSAVGDSSWKAAEWIAQKFGFPRNGSALLIPAFLGGYPAGAQAVTQAYKDGRLSKRSAKNMLAFCSNAGPAFIFGMAAQHFSTNWAGWLLWLIHILSAAAVGIITKDDREIAEQGTINTAIPLPTAVQRSIRAMASICGWVVLFRVMLKFAEKWILFRLPAEISVAVAGVLELSNGCCGLDAVALPGLRFVMAEGMLSFGGICVAMQTASVTEDLGIREYLKGKLLQTAVSMILALGVQEILFSPGDRIHFPPFLLWSGMILTAITGVVLGRKGKNSRFSAAFRV